MIIIRYWISLLLGTLLLTGCFSGEGVLKIGTEPGDAQVFVNTVWQGNSGVKPGEYLSLLLKEGTYLIECRKEINDEDEYYSRREIVVKKNAEQILTLVMAKRPTQFGKQRQRELEKMKEEQERRETFLPQDQTTQNQTTQNQTADNEVDPLTPEKKSRVEINEGETGVAEITDLGRIDKKTILAQIFAELVSIPRGSFVMGSMQGEPDEKPVRTVDIQPFKMMATAVTFDMWDACFVDQGCVYIPADRDWGRGNRPVIYVSYHDIVDQFIPWLERQTGKKFRLPSEAEWEYAARAGSHQSYYWGDEMIQNRVNCNACGSKWDGVRSAPVKSFPANPWGLYEMLGNVYEWTADCWQANYYRAPSTGAPWLDGDCQQAPFRGGAWSADPSWIRSANRDADSRHYRFGGLGFRLVLDTD